MMNIYCDDGSTNVKLAWFEGDELQTRVSAGTVAKLAMRQPFVLFKGLTFQKLCLPGAFRPGDHHNKMLRPGLCVVHASPQYL
ncbi:TPA: plasmid segregation protein ParM domain-containing protein [Pseudomonas aeruginosa]